MEGLDIKGNPGLLAPWRELEVAVFSEEDVGWIFDSSVVLPLDFGAVEEVLDFFVEVELGGGVGLAFGLGNFVVGLGIELVFVECVPDFPDLAGDAPWALGFESVDDGEGLFELVEVVFLLFGEGLFNGDFAEGLDFVFDVVGEFAGGVVVGVFDDDGFVAPAKGHEVTDGGDFEFGVFFGLGGGGEPGADVLDDVEVAVHLVVFDEGSAEDDVGNEDEGDDVDGGLGAGDEAGDEEACGDADEGGSEHPEEVGQEHGPDAEDGVAYEEVDDALDEGEEAEGDVFPDDVAGDAEAVVSLAEEKVAVADDFFGGVGHAEEEGGDEGEEEVGGDVECVGEGVGAFFGVAHDYGDEDGEGGGFEEGGGEVGAVPQFGEEGSFKLVGEADPVVPKSAWGCLGCFLQGDGL